MNYLDRLAIQAGYEPTHTDKLLAKRNIKKLENLMKKEELTREDIADILYLLAAEEIKLLYLSEKDRYVMLRIFATIRDVATIIELLDAALNLENNEENKEYIRTQKKLWENTFKTLVDLYNFLARSTLSMEGKAFDILSTPGQRIEYIYPVQQETAHRPTPFLWLFRK
jgi:hypothetical protein